MWASLFRYCFFPSFCFHVYTFMWFSWKAHIVSVLLQLLEFILHSSLDPVAVCRRRKTFRQFRSFLLVVPSLTLFLRLIRMPGSHWHCWASGLISGSLINPCAWTDTHWNENNTCNITGCCFEITNQRDSICCCSVFPLPPYKKEVGASHVNHLWGFRASLFRTLWPVQRGTCCRNQGRWCLYKSFRQWIVTCKLRQPQYFLDWNRRVEPLFPASTA